MRAMILAPFVCYDAFEASHLWAIGSHGIRIQQVQRVFVSSKQIAPNILGRVDAEDNGDQSVQSTSVLLIKAF